MAVNSYKKYTLQGCSRGSVEKPDEGCALMSTLDH